MTKLLLKTWSSSETADWWNTENAFTQQILRTLTVEEALTGASKHVWGVRAHTHVSKLRFQIGKVWHTVQFLPIHFYVSCQQDRIETLSNNTGFTEFVSIDHILDSVYAVDYGQTSSTTKDNSSFSFSFYIYF